MKEEINFEYVIKGNLQLITKSVENGSNPLLNDVTAGICNTDIKGVTYQLQYVLTPNPDNWVEVGVLRFTEDGVVVKEYDFLETEE